MVARVEIPQVELTSNHSRYLINTHTDKLKLRNADIWINGSKIKFSQYIGQTIRNINRFSLKTNVKAELEDGRLVLKTNKRTLKVNDPSKVLEHLVSAKKIGNSTNHYIQLIRQGTGDVRFLYSTNKNHGFLALCPAKSNRESFSGIGNVHVKPRQEEVQDPVFISLPDQVHSIRRTAVLHKSTILEDSRIQVDLLVAPELKLHMAEIVNKSEKIDEEAFELWKQHYEEYTENLKKGNFKEMKAYRDIYTLKQQNVYKQKLFRQL